MKLIYKITDDDIGERSKELKEPTLRMSARGIVIRKDKKIAIFNKSKKNEYKLPGGGIENTETPEETFKREILEETGCEIEIISKLGTIEEYKSLINFKQISNVFVGKVTKDIGNLKLTEKEKDEGGKLLWETPEKALELITNCYDKSEYTRKFAVLRDRKILEYYIENI